MFLYLLLNEIIRCILFLDGTFLNFIGDIDLWGAILLCLNEIRTDFPGKGHIKK